jgi:hypothetical protein
MAEKILIRPKTFKERLANFWYHYKWHTIIITFLLISMTVGFTQCATKENPDYKIMLCMDKYIPDGIVPAIETYFEQYADDINGDGKVIVHVVDASTGVTDELQRSQSSKLMGELQIGEVMLIMTDETYFKRLDERDVFDTADYFPDKNGKAMNIRNTELAELLNTVSDKFISHDVYISKRMVAGTMFDGNEKSMTAEKNSIELLQRFMDAQQSVKAGENS